MENICYVLKNLQLEINCIALQSKYHFVVGYSLTGDSNGYDYSSTVANNGYLGSKDNYQNGAGSFYGAGDANHKLSNHANSHSLINVGGQGNVGGGDVGNSYSGYSVNNNGNEYAGYSNIYENSASESYTNTPTRAASLPLRGYIGGNNGDSIFNAFSTDSVHKDSDISQYAASSSSSSSKRIPAYSGYSKPTRVTENYPEGSADSSVQGYQDSSGASSYSESDHIYTSYSPGGLTSEYSFGKQKNDPLNLKGGNKYNGVYSILSGTRYTRGNTGHVSYNRDIPSFMSGSPGSHFSKAPGTYSSGKLSKYGYKNLSNSRYAPTSGVTYTRDRDGYYMPYSKGSGKIILIKNNSPSYMGRVYSDEPLYASSNGGYKSKSGFANGYPASLNFDGYTGSSSYDDGPTILRRYRTSNGPMFLQKSIYP